MEKDKKKALAGAGILGAIGLACHLARKRAEPICTPEDTKCVGSDLYVCTEKGQWTLAERNYTHCTVPIAKVPIDSYELWLMRTRPESLDCVQLGQSVSVYFKLCKDDEEIWLAEPIIVNWKITRPDGTTVTITRDCPAVSCRGEYNRHYYGTNIPGTYYNDFMGIEFTFNVVPLVTQIFYPLEPELIYDASPYCQETIDTAPSGLSGQALDNLIAIAQRDVDLDIKSIDLQISKFFEPEANDGRLNITIIGDVKNCPTSFPQLFSQARIPLTLRLIPQQIYEKRYIATGGYTYSLRHPKFLKYPSGYNLSLLYPYSGVSRYYDIGDPTSKIGMDLATCSVSPFQKTSVGIWGRYGSFMNLRATDQEWVQKELKVGDRYEVVLQSGVGLDPYLGGHKFAAYPLKQWHIGYVIIA